MHPCIAVKAVMSLKNDRQTQVREIARDYILLLLFTGLRRAEASRLTSDNVDLKARTLTVTDTKNHETLTLPPPDFIFGMLKRLLNHKMRNDVTAGPESIPSRARHNQI